MIIISEKLNSSLPAALELLQTGGDADIINTIRAQAGFGATYIDINAAMCDDELATLKRIISLADTAGECGIVVDTPDINTAAACLEMYPERELIINSIAPGEKYNDIIRLAMQTRASLIALPLSDGKIPAGAEARVENAQRICDAMEKTGFPCERLYIDILIESAAVKNNAGITALHTLEGIKNTLSGIKCVCGLSNISFGLPARAQLNSTMLAMLIAGGIDAVICDPESERIRAVTASAAVLTGNDEYCLNYIEKARRCIIK